ncbi:MAG: hypothetical protein WD049_08560 [Candidatus Paceibacterota bacterium]
MSSRFVMNLDEEFPHLPKAPLVEAVIHWQALPADAYEPAKLLGQLKELLPDYLSQNLKTVAAPVDGNPNHVNVTEWPRDKPSQKIIAQEVAAVAKYLAPPNTGS